MNTAEFIKTHKLNPLDIDALACLDQLLQEMELGLADKGNIPMVPSYLPLDIRPVTGQPCCVLDAGGTNLRVAKAVFGEDGSCSLSGLHKTAMPGTNGELSFHQFYHTLGTYVNDTGCPERVGLCFSYNVLLERELDGILHSWCKEVKVPDAPGKPVGASLRQAIGGGCQSVRVLNDSTAALLGAHVCNPNITVGLILGTGINVCYVEQCSKIPKVPNDLRSDTMIISTEIGEFRGFPKSTFDEAVIAASDEPDMAHAEKQCSGAYLGNLICRAWQSAAQEGILEEGFTRDVTLPEISDYLAGRETAIPGNPAAREIGWTMLGRAAKIAAILTAGPIVRSCPSGGECTIVIEGSQFRKLTGFGDFFCRELEALLTPMGIRFSIAEVENSCLVGAALAAFADPM